MASLPGCVLVAGIVVAGLAAAVPAGPGRTAQAASVARSQAAMPAASYREAISGTLVTFDMVRVPAGRDVPSFYLGRTEVTWDMYDVFALGLDTPPAGAPVARPSNPYGAPDYGWGHAGFPVMSVTRAAAEAFCTWLSQKTGRAYRLPTEGEWTHAALLASGGDGLDAPERSAHAWWRENAGGRTHAVGTRAADALGLFDLFGNTAEWVTTPTNDLVTRGGSFRDGPDLVSPDARAPQAASWNETDPQLPKSRWWLSDAPFVGFRLARTLEGASP